jgi:hypothetical protein
MVEEEVHPSSEKEEKNDTAPSIILTARLGANERSFVSPGNFCVYDHGIMTMIIRLP